MFNVIEITDYYNRRGAVIKTEKRIVFSNENVVETAKYRYLVNPKDGYSVTPAYTGMTKHTHMQTEQDGERISFAEIFRIVEGNDAYNAIMNDDNACVNERDWVASKRA